MSTRSNIWAGGSVACLQQSGLTAHAALMRAPWRHATHRPHGFCNIYVQAWQARHPMRYCHQALQGSAAEKRVWRCLNSLVVLRPPTRLGRPEIESTMQAEPSEGEPPLMLMPTEPGARSHLATVCLRAADSRSCSAARRARASSRFARQLALLACRSVSSSHCAAACADSKPERVRNYGLFPLRCEVKH